jgi:hypothetical protein
VSELVIDLFEMIQVNRDDRQIVALLFGSRDLSLETFFSVSPIVQTGKRIDDCHAVKLVGAHPLFHRHLHLFSEAMPKELEMALVV